MARVRLTKDLLTEGYDYGEVGRRERSGELVRIRRGAYTIDAPAARDDAGDAHLRLIEATVGQIRTAAVVSHTSAAVVHGLPVWADELRRVHLTRDRVGGGSIRRYVHLHAAALEPDEIVHFQGFLVTSLTRTLVDVARTSSLRRSVPILDAALAAGLSKDELTARAGEYGGRPGAGRLRRAVALADGLSESVGESVSRVVFTEHGVCPPRLQYVVAGLDGKVIGRSDFCWERERTLGEFDGKVKYGQLLRPGQDASDVVFAEKVREDALRDLGWQVVRWVWDDLSQPQRLIERLNRAFERGRRTPG